MNRGKSRTFVQNVKHLQEKDYYYRRKEVKGLHVGLVVLAVLVVDVAGSPSNGHLKWRQTPFNSFRHSLLCSHRNTNEPDCRFKLLLRYCTDLPQTSYLFITVEFYSIIYFSYNISFHFFVWQVMVHGSTHMKSLTCVSFSPKDVPS